LHLLLTRQLLASPLPPASVSGRLSLAAMATAPALIGCLPQRPAARRSTAMSSLDMQIRRGLRKAVRTVLASSHLRRLPCAARGAAFQVPSFASPGEVQRTVRSQRSSRRTGQRGLAAGLTPPRAGLPAASAPPRGGGSPRRPGRAALAAAPARSGCLPQRRAARRSAAMRGLDMRLRIGRATDRKRP
jgi:hypothetical protein